MPRYARKRRASRRKSSYKRRRSSRRRPTRKLSVCRSRTSLLPDAFLCKLRYSQLIGHDFTASSIPGRHQWRVNSLYDPDFTTAGHQPLGRDQWAVFYNRYLVYGCKFTITWSTTSSTEQAEIAVQLRPNSIMADNMDTVREDPLTIFRAVLGSEDSGQAVRVCRGYADVAKIRGVPKSRVRNESDYQAIFGFNPPIDPTICVYIQNPQTTNAVTTKCRVDLTYYCRFYDRKQQLQS